MQLGFNFIKHELNKIKARLQNALRHTHKKELPDSRAAHSLRFV